MRFKTIIITRKKVIFTLICTGVTAVCGITAAVVRTSGKAAEVFKSEDTVYEDILSEGLPTEDDEFDLKNAVNKILGFNLDEPQTIIEEYSAYFENVQAENNQDGSGAESVEDAAEQSDEDAEEHPNGETAEQPEEQSAEPELPTRDMIYSSVGLAINNATDYDVNIDAMCAEELTFSINDEGPQVLVVHTHTTECYDGDQMSGETERTTDDSRNVIEVGNVICDTLESYGIKTYHDTTYHDYPSYQGSYTRALTTISSRLAEYPSVKIVLDIHRDAFIYAAGSKLTVSSDQNGISTAQVMLVCGTDSMGLEHKNWRENLKLAAKIQNAAEIMYPGLMRPVNLRTERFNMHMTTGSLLIDVGSNGNTLDQAKEGGKDVARAIAAVLTNQ
ncbi:MAG: stage II sporulation protein P [Oscillospiraceae bacterium]|nr:stage II sporulation protein P [Oscillospiraceae bacterium]